MTRLYRKALTPLLVGALAAGCTDLDVTNPSQRTTDTFYQNRADALAAVNATYHALQELGVFGRWLVFADDMRSDIAFSASPWPELANFTRTVLASYDFEVNIHLWQHNYWTIFAANQVIASVPNTNIAQADRDRFVAEAKFIRALAYFNLVTLFQNVPLVTTPLGATERPATAPPDQVWAQIEQDLNDARGVLPPSWTGNDIGRATSGAATALLGKAHLQQREWALAAARFAEVISSNRYQLLAEYADNFRADRDNNAESIFEIQFTDDTRLAEGSAGYSGPKLYGPCGPAFCDANPTQWYFDQFFPNPSDRTVYDPRLDVTIFWNRPGGMDVFGTPFATRYADRLNILFPKKYTQYYTARTDELFDNPINFKVLRLGGVLLMHAEALNEGGNPDAAQPFVNLVRGRPSVSQPPIPLGLTQAQMRAAIEHEYLMEMGFEAERFRYLQRQNLLTAAYLPTLISHDAQFSDFVVGRSNLLPIPNSETDLNPNATQNPNY
ncbi:MAG TPA: RagB/SusD family nutrient uptake outer membrane protein [Gemmatimonadaceae bacterium]|nr:RagB/SusD family nutrient uptake outer membrane protein [Gemmatimonadaceae bacterium]